MRWPLDIIAITPPAIKTGEAERVVAMLGSGAVQRVHLRHPGATAEQLYEVLSAVPQEYRSQISLHYFPRLVSEFPGVGFHFSGRCPEAALPPETVKSASVHADELRKDFSALAYVFCSPVFPSISKPGYGTATMPAFPCAEVPMIALGGVVPGRFDALRREGFAGAAMLGYFDVDETELNERLNILSRCR